MHLCGGFCVSQPDSDQNFSPDQQVSPDAGNPACLDSVDASLPDDETLQGLEIQALLEDLNQMRALEHERVSRIYHLEKALDQALVYLKELRGQIQVQSILETQLAQTEAFASVQQQAIVRLKQQLQQQEQTLRLRDRVMLTVLGIIESSILLPSDSLEYLPPALDETNETPRQLTLDFDIDPTKSERIIELEMQLASAHQHIQDLSGLVEQLETHLRQAQTNLEEQQALELTLRQAHARTTERNSVIVGLQKDLAIAQIKVEELELQLAKQLKLQAKWQQNSQELEREHDRALNRIQALEQEIAEMQEQIFRQARQASEYEAAIQHWKDRYSASQEQLVHLKELLEHASLQSDSDTGSAAAIHPLLPELLTIIQSMTEPEAIEPLPEATSLPARFNILDVPDFLMRRRNHWAR